MSGKRSRARDLELVRRFAPYLRPHLGSFALALGVLPFLTACELARPWILKEVVDRHLVPGTPTGTLVGWGLTYLAVIVFQAGFNFLHNYTAQVAGERALTALRRDVFARYQALDMAYLDKHAVGQLATRATSDVESLNQMFSSGVLAIVADSINFLGILAMMFWLDAGLATILVFAIPLLYFFSSRFQAGMRACFQEAREKTALMNAFTTENVAGARVVHLFGLADRHAARFDALNAAYRDCYHRSNVYDALLYSSVDMLSTLCVAAFLLGGAYALDEGRITLGVLVAFVDLMVKFFDPLRDLSAKLSVVQAAMAAAEKIAGLLDVVPAIQDPPDPLPLPPDGRGAVAFRGVGFAYRPDHPVVKGIDLEIAPGEKLAVVGPTGAGKTTLIRLLERFYDPTEGSITLDGVDLRRLRVAELRAALAVVLQEVFLVRGSVLDNVRLGDPEVSEEAVRAACEAVEADAFIRRLPGGYKGMVEEAGSNLSSGERQLISFARALVRRPRVLILDEATALVDVETEDRIRRALKVLLAGRTAIVIAHRLSTIQACDRIAVVEKGRVVELGTQAALIARGGIFAKLHALYTKDARLLSETAPAPRAARVG